MADLSTPEGKLVERLRHGVPVHDPDGRGAIADTEAADRTMDEAADALSRIAAERDEALADLEAERMYYAQLFDVVTATELLADVRKVNLEAAERERDELKAEVERLREALKPFATFGENNTDAEGWAGTECQRERIVDWFGPTDFRTARAALRDGFSP